MLKAVLDDFRGLVSAFRRERRYDCSWDSGTRRDFKREQLKEQRTASAGVCVEVDWSASVNEGVAALLKLAELRIVGIELRFAERKDYRHELRADGKRWAGGPEIP